MWQRFSISEVRIAGHYLGALVQLLACLMLVPLAVACISGEWDPAARYLFSIGVALVIGSGLRLLHFQPPRLTRPQALPITGLAWIVLAAVAAIPLYLSGHFPSYLDALFESVSGFTTTGVTVVQDLNHLSNADNMWRFMTQLIGGLGLIVVALSLGLFGRRVDASLYSSEGRSEKVLPSVIQTAKFIARATATVILFSSLVLAAICIALGMEPLRGALHGLWLSIAGFATGGFSPMSSSMMYYNSLAVEIVLMVLMTFGSINFMLFSEVRKDRVSTFFGDIEVKTLAIWLSVMTVAFVAAMCSSKVCDDTGFLLRRGLFTLVSTFSTSGFQAMTTNQLLSVVPSGALLVLALLMAVGGGAGSTAGGIKLVRIGIVFKSITAAFKEALSPVSSRVVAEYSHLGRRRLSSEVVKEAMMIFILFVTVCVLGAIAGVAYGNDAIAAIVDSVVMTSNGGISAGIATAEMPTGLEIVYILQMWAGRLEFVTLAALLIKVAVTFKPRRKPVPLSESESLEYIGLMGRNNEAIKELSKPVALRGRERPSEEAVGRQQGARLSGTRAEKRGRKRRG